MSEVTRNHVWGTRVGRTVIGIDEVTDVATAVTAYTTTVTDHEDGMLLTATFPTQTDAMEYTLTWIEAQVADIVADRA